MTRPQILIIDEITIHQRLAALMAQRFGTEPLIVNGFADALNKLESKPDIKLVLLDLDIPHSAIGNRCLRALNRYRRLRKRDFAIVANTAYVLESELAECMRMGADDVLPKPYTCQHFREILRKWTAVEPQVKLAS